MIRSRFRMFGSRLVVLLTTPMHPALAAPPCTSVPCLIHGPTGDTLDSLTRNLTRRAALELSAREAGLIRFIAR